MYGTYYKKLYLIFIVGFYEVEERDTGEPTAISVIRVAIADISVVFGVVKYTSYATILLFQCIS